MHLLLLKYIHSLMIKSITHYRSKLAPCFWYRSKSHTFMPFKTHYDHDAYGVLTHLIDARKKDSHNNYDE